MNVSDVLRERWRVILSVACALALSGCGRGPDHLAEIEIPAPRVDPVLRRAVQGRWQWLQGPSAAEAEAAGNLVQADAALAPGGQRVIPLLAFAGHFLFLQVQPRWLDVRLELYRVRDTRRVRLFAVDDAPRMEELIYAFAEDGFYELVIQDVSGTGGEYFMDLTTTSGVAVTLAPEDAITGLLGSGQALVYLYRGQEGDALTLRLDPAPELDLRVAAFRLDLPAGTLVALDAGGPGPADAWSWTLPEAGLYLIEVAEAQGRAGTFSMAFELQAAE